MRHQPALLGYFHHLVQCPGKPHVILFGGRYGFLGASAHDEVLGAESGG
jgi:hypothetical protein